MKSVFFDKLIDRMDKLDPESLQIYFLRLFQERGLLETIFQSIREGVILLDGKGMISYANHAAESMIGFSIEKTRNRSISRFIRDIEWDRILELDDDEWAKLVSMEVEIAYPERRIVSLYVVPLTHNASCEEGAVVILQDVTREREEEATILESERLNAIKLLAAGVAHEIGNPLNALNIHLQLIDRDVSSLLDGNEPDFGSDSAGHKGAEPANETIEGLKELIGIARNEVSRLDMIIKQFLQAIRPVAPNLAPTNIDDILKETLTFLKHEVENRRIQVTLDLSKDVPIINLDGDQIKQAFFNIMKNAFQAMPDGGSLKIARECTSSEVKISFHDTGRGISPGKLSLIFEPYYTTKEQGHGLGLMVVQRIIQEHGGRLEVESKAGKGAIFTISLPLSEKRVRLLKAVRPEADEEQNREKVR